MSHCAALGALAALLAGLAACASPEAFRIRGGGRGADVGNVGRPAQFHAGAEPYYQTRCVTTRVECRGPLPVFGQTSRPD